VTFKSNKKSVSIFMLLDEASADVQHCSVHQQPVELPRTRAGPEFHGIWSSTKQLKNSSQSLLDSRIGCTRTLSKRQRQ
jgi:hypothetical protein